MPLPVLEREIGGMLQLALADLQNACFARAPGSNYGRRGSNPVRIRQHADGVLKQ
jgi:hypothetical protein